MNGVFDKLNKLVDCENLFRLGPFNRFENSVRVYMDELNFDSVESHSDFVVNELEKRRPIKEWYALFACDRETNEFPDVELDAIENFGLISSKREEYKFYDSEDELFRWVFASDGSAEENQAAVRYFLSRFVGGSDEFYLPADLYFVSKDFKFVANIYDDRGIDFVSL